MTIVTAPSPEDGNRKPWSTPRVIVSEATDAQSNGSINPPDGTTPIFGPYGTEPS